MFIQFKQRRITTQLYLTGGIKIKHLNICTLQAKQSHLAMTVLYFKDRDLYNTVSTSYLADLSEYLTD